MHDFHKGLRARTKIVIWGAAGHALVVADILRIMGPYQIVGLLDDMSPDRHGSIVNGLPILGGRERLDALKSEGVANIIVAIGDCESRLRLAEVAKSKGFRLAIAIHPRAVVAIGSKVCEGTVIAAGAVVNPGAKIGPNVIVNTGATVDHECELEEGVHLGPGAHLGGLVKIGRGAWIGIGANIRDRIRIGANSIIGAGAVVTKDVPSNVVAYGVPAKVVRGIGERRKRVKAGLKSSRR